ncbi:MAG: phosphatidate cytidylyltransferase [Acidobacteria bacterium]|nr:phosphatidate cytidylyltransferase [Acidobacteriota bacterium]
MTRVLSGAALLILAVLVVWLAPAALFLAAAELLLVAAFVEYAALARASGLAVPAVPAGAAAALTAAAFARLGRAGAAGAPLDVVLMAALVGLGAVSLARWQGGRGAVAAAAAAVFPCLYLGLPIGAMIGIRESRGPEALFLMMLTVFASDTAQYYAGRAVGRRPLAARISPKKTVEGAIGGFLAGAAVLAIVGAWWLPAAPAALRAALGAAIVALGIAGDLFESMLKRSAGVKDSSTLIPGHGGILDRVDALLFAAPVYYIVLKYV